MADLSNLKISESYQRVLQRDPTTGFLQDLVGDIPTNIIFNGTTLRYIDGNQQNGYVLTSDANGNASWAAAGGGGVDVYWSSSTADANAIVNSGLTTSKVGIGTTIPNKELTVSGSVSATSEIHSTSYSFGDVKILAQNSASNVRLGFDGSYDYFEYGKDDDVSHYFYGALGKATFAGSVFTSGRTFLGTIDAAGAGYTNDKILVSQGDGEVNYLTTAELKADIADADYWTASTANANAIVNSGMTTSKVGIGTTIPNHELSVSGSMSASSRIFSEQLTVTGTGENFVGGDLNMIGANIVFENNQGLRFENAAGTEFGNILMNTSDNMVYQNLRSNKDVIFRAGNAGNEGKVIIQQGGTSDSIATFGTTGGMSLTGDLGVTGRTFLGTIDAAGAGYTNDKILVAQSNGEVEYLTTAELKADIGDADYWTASTADANSIVNSGMTTSKVGIGTTIPNHTLSVSGTVSASTKVISEDVVGSSRLISSGKTFIGNPDAAGAGYTTDKILVAQADGEVEYLTTAELKEDIGISEYWSASTANANAIVNSGMTTSKVGIGTTIPNHELSVSGTISASTSYVVGNATLTTSELDISSGNFTLDVEGDITIDANGADIILSDDGTNFGRFKRDTSDFVIKSETNNKDILFKGQDGGSTITALQLDMSDSGTAIFNNNIVIADDGFIGSSSDTDAIAISSSEVTISPISNFLSAVRLGDAVQLQFGAGQDGNIYVTGDDFYIDQATSDKDIIFKGTDGTSDITALTLDMSDAGTAIFNHDLSLPDDGQIKLGASDDGLIYEESSNLVIQSTQSDSDILFKGNDNGTITSAAVLDMSISDFIVKGSVIMSGNSSKGNYAIISILHQWIFQVEV